MNVWVMSRGPLLSALALGWGVSMMISSALTLRLVLDGALSFLFIPVFQLIAFVIVYQRVPRRLPLDVAIDRFFDSNRPWLVWLLLLGVWSMVQSPREAALWSSAEVLIAIAGMAVAMLWSRRGERAVLPWRDAVRYRAIAWTAVVTYFLGLALWPEIVWRLPL